MTVLEQPNFITIPDYLAGEEGSEVEHEYLGGTVHAMAGATNQHNAIELHTGIDRTIPLPQIEASLPLAELYERVKLKSP